MNIHEQLNFRQDQCIESNNYIFLIPMDGCLHPESAPPCVPPTETSQAFLCVLYIKYAVFLGGYTVDGLRQNVFKPFNPSFSFHVSAVSFIPVGLRSTPNLTGECQGGSTRSRLVNPISIRTMKKLHRCPQVQSHGGSALIMIPLSQGCLGLSQ